MGEWWTISTNIYRPNNIIEYPSNNFRSIGKIFLEKYYSDFDNNINSLYNLYNINATLTFDTKECQGKEQIKNLYNSIKLENMKHKIQLYNSQPLGKNKISILVVGEFSYVAGSNWIFNSTNIQKIKYVENFIIINIGNKWYIQNQIFRKV